MYSFKSEIGRRSYIYAGIFDWDEDTVVFIFLLCCTPIVDFMFDF